MVSLILHIANQKEHHKKHTLKQDYLVFVKL